MVIKTDLGIVKANLKKYGRRSSSRKDTEKTRKPTASSLNKIPPSTGNDILSALQELTLKSDTTLTNAKKKIEYKRTSKLGSGSFGDVYLYINEKSKFL